MEPPGRLEEQARGPAASWRRRRGRGRARSGRRRAGGCPQRLVELLRVAEQHEARRGAGRSRRRWPARSGRPRRRTGRRPRLDHLRRCPQPRGPGGEVGRPSASRAPDVRVVLARDDPLVVEHLVLRRRAGRPDVDALLASAALSTAPSRLPMTLWLVPVMPTRSPAASERRRSSGRRCRSCRSRAGPGSASVVWSSATAEPASGVEVGLAVAPERGARRWPARGARPSSRSRAGAVGPVGVDPVLGDPLAELDERGLVVVGADPVERHDRARVRAVAAALEVDGRAAPDRRDDLADLPRRTGCRPAGLLSWRRVVRPARARGRSPGREPVAPELLPVPRSRRPGRPARAGRSGRPRRRAARASGPSAGGTPTTSTCPRGGASRGAARAATAVLLRRRPAAGSSGRLPVGEPVGERLDAGLRLGQLGRGARARGRRARDGPRPVRRRELVAAAPPASRAAAGC